MVGKLVYQVKNIHETKPSDMTMKDGTVVKTIRAVEDPKGQRIMTRIVRM